MIGAFSKSLDACQKNYSVSDKELLAVVKGIENYRHYLLGKKFELRTDHKALEFMWKTKNTNSRILRWALKLADYDFTIKYIKGEENIADGLSRCNRIEYETEDIDEISKQQIMREYHETLGHGTSNLMKFAIGQTYNWKGMYKDIEKFYNSCLTCLKAGTEKVNSKNKIILTKCPNQLWETDIMVEPLPNGKMGFILVVIDHYSKWTETRCLKDKSKESISAAIKELVALNGIPQQIYSDSGLEFDNKTIRELSEALKIDWKFASPYNHKSTGAVERVIQTLRNKLKKLTNFGEKDWRKLLEKATLAVNLSYNRAISTSPYIFKNCKQLDLEIDREKQKSSQLFTKEDLIRKRDLNFEKYSREIQKGKLTIKTNLVPGDRVLIYRSLIGGKKSEAKWKNGHQIIKKSSEDSYIVKCIKNNSTLRVNKRHIKKDTSCLEGGMLA